MTDISSNQNYAYDGIPFHKGEAATGLFRRLLRAKPMVANALIYATPRSDFARWTQVYALASGQLIPVSFLQKNPGQNPSTLIILRINFYGT